MTSLIRARWTRGMRTRPSLPPSLPPLRTIASARFSGEEEREGGGGDEFRIERIFKRIGRKRGEGGGGGWSERVANRFEIINLDLFRARIARHYLPIIAPSLSPPLHPPPPPPRMNFCPHEFGQKLDVLATISLVFGKQGFVWLGDDRRATVADTWLFFFFFSGFSFPPREGGETGRLMKIVTANRRGWWKWEAMRWTVINAMLSWKGREEGVENCILLIRDFGFPMLFIVIYEGNAKFLSKLWKIKTFSREKNFRFGFRWREGR